MQDFSKRLDCDDKICRVVVPLAKAGYGRRGLASLPLAVFLVMAGVQARAGEVRSWGGALQAVEQQPFGNTALCVGRRRFDRLRTVRLGRGALPPHPPAARGHAVRGFRQPQTLPRQGFGQPRRAGRPSSSRGPRSAGRRSWARCGC